MSWIDTRCATCTGDKRCVLGDGPRPARVAAVGEAPGREEDSGGRPFIGDAGKEFNHNYLPLAGLDRDDVYITNTRKCRPDNNRKPTKREAQGCADHFLPSELQAVRPEVVILMGATACSLLEAVDLEVEHGVPRFDVLYGHAAWYVPMYHPAAGMHNTSMMIPMLEDWERLKPWLQTGVWQWATERYESRDYRLARTRKEVVSYFDAWYGRYDLMGGDTESHAKKPFSVQVSCHPGTGMMVLTEDHEALDELGSILGPITTFGTEIALHHAPSDLEIFKKLIGGEFAYRDTMQELYHLGNHLKLGLKVAAFRLLGRRRQSWEEVVGAISRQKLNEWIWQALVEVEEWRTIEKRYHKKSGREIQPKITKHIAEGKLLHILKQENPEYEAWKKIKEFGWHDWLPVMEAQMGVKMPLLGIANCDLMTARDYGCSDADDTLTIALKLEGMREEAEREWDVQPEDVDDVNIHSHLNANA